MNYDGWKTMSDREGESSECEHVCANGHVYLKHDVYDAEGKIPNACCHADEAALGPGGEPHCEVCAQWVWQAADAVSEAARLASMKEAV